MLLPHSTGAGRFEQKPWSVFLNHGPFSMHPIPLAMNPASVQLGLPTLRSATGPCVPAFHGVITQPPALFPSVQPAAIVRPFFQTQVAKPELNSNSIVQEPSTPPKKKLKIFRPWDDESTTATSSGLSSKKCETSPVESVERPKNGDPKTTSVKVETKANLESSIFEDDIDRSKSAFEVFATNLGKSPEGHRCIYCGKIYSRKYGLKIHLRTHTGFKPLKCKVCQRPFGDPSNLNKHVRLHADSLSTTEFKANSDEKFGKESIDNHDSSHYPLSVLKCPFCACNLFRKRDLERHLNSIHPNEQLVDVERL